MTEHLQNGLLKDHMRNSHKYFNKTKISKKNVSCIKKFDNIKKQKMYEALMILKERPSNNRMRAFQMF